VCPSDSVAGFSVTVMVIGRFALRFRSELDVYYSYIICQFEKEMSICTVTGNTTRTIVIMQVRSHWKGAGDAGAADFV